MNLLFQHFLLCVKISQQILRVLFYENIVITKNIDFIFGLQILFRQISTNPFVFRASFDPNSTSLREKSLKLQFSVQSTPLLKLKVNIIAILSFVLRFLFRISIIICCLRPRKGERKEKKGENISRKKRQTNINFRAENFRARTVSIRIWGNRLSQTSCDFCVIAIDDRVNRIWLLKLGWGNCVSWNVWDEGCAKFEGFGMGFCVLCVEGLQISIALWTNSLVYANLSLQHDYFCI